MPTKPVKVTEGEVVATLDDRLCRFLIAGDVDGDGVRLRMDLARQYQLNGVALWALGFEDDAVWDAILPTISD